MPSSSPRSDPAAAAAPWWRTAVIYQIYPRSFCDSNGDGIGDLRGIASKLDYVAALGVTAIWLNPTYPSPNTDWGYDVSDYRGVHPDLGTPRDMDDLIAACHDRGLRLILDLVPNHTSDQHPWFLEARSSKDNPRRDWYLFAPGKSGGPPNNWLDIVDTCGWVYDQATDEWYFHNFLATQPDLNWWNSDVRKEFEDILSYWFDKGVDGFRIDVAHGLVKDRLLRDNPVRDPEDAASREHHLAQIPLYNYHQPEVHEVYRRWRKIARSYADEKLLYGETWALTDDETRSYYGEGDELQLTLNGPSLGLPPSIPALAAAVEAAENFGPHAWPSWTWSNHDLSRFPTRWARGDRSLAVCFLLLLLALRGTPVLYYGDELAMEDTVMDPSLWKDPMHLPGHSSRDRARTPMPWADLPGGGFTPPDVTPWLPLGDLDACTVAAQDGVPGSPLSFTRRMLAFRTAHEDFAAGSYEKTYASESAWFWHRGDRWLVALNLGDQPVALLESGWVMVATDPALEGAALPSMLAPHAGLVARRGA